MMTAATRNEHYTETHATEPVGFLAFALRAKTWELGCTMGRGHLRERRISLLCALVVRGIHALQYGWSAGLRERLMDAHEDQPEHGWRQGAMRHNPA